MSSNLEQLIEQALKLPPEDLRQLRARLDQELARTNNSSDQPLVTEEEFKQILVAKGIITRAKDRTAVGDFEPIEVRGEPVSETIIRERG